MADLDEGAHRQLANQIRRRAHQAGLGMKELAERASISEAGLHRILAGERSPRLQTLCQLARVLRCRPRDLVP